MSTILRSARLKLDRARHHLDAFHETMDRFLESEPYRVVREFQHGATQHVYRVEIREEPPEQLPLIAGDVFQNLRSALDHAVFALSDSATLSDKQRKSINFPIITDPAGFKKKSGEDTKRALGLALLTPPVRAALERLQPASSRDALALLHDLNNIDKHRIIHTVAAVSVEATEFRQRDVGFIGRWFHPGPFDHGTEIARYAFADPQPDVDMKLDPTFTIGFADSAEVEGMDAERIFELCQRKVAEVLDILETAGGE